LTPTVAVVGVSHTHSCAAVRERLYVAPDSAPSVARTLAGGAHEAVVLSTCNRTEFYLTGRDGDEATHRAAAVFAHLADGVDPTPALYAHTNERAADHLFRVCAGLDAAVLGDTHVTAQVRHAHGIARAAGASGPLLDRLFEMAAAASKRIRSETAVSSGHTSVPAAAIAVANSIAGPLCERRLVVIGAGATARLAALNAAWRGCRDIVVVNRGTSRARQLADRVGGRASTFDALDRVLSAADIVVCATAAPGFILTVGQLVASAEQQRQRPLLVLDLAIPRDVDPAVRSQARLQLIDIDDLADLVEMNAARRSAGLERADAIARDEANRYERWRRARAAVPAIVAMRDAAERARRSVLGRHGAALEKLPPAERGLVEAITSELVAKLLHEPTLELRRRSLARSA
jgi:glutamyl-tRNA reductase